MDQLCVLLAIGHLIFSSYVDRTYGELQKKTYGARCTKLQECGEQMICYGGICQCRTGFNRELSASRDECVLAGTLHGNCPQHRDCGNYLTCKNKTGKCECDERFYENSNECLRVKYLNDACLESIECEKKLQCEKGRCVCPTGYVDDRKGACVYVNKPGGDCAGNASACGSYLTCANIDGKNLCICIKGYFKVDDDCRKVKYLQHPCNTTVECASKFKCENKVCTCPAGHFINKRRDDCEKNDLVGKH